MRICIVSYMYPGKNFGGFVFVKQLVDAIAARGHECYVVAPFNVNHYRKLTPIREKYTVDKGSVQVFRPYYLSFSGIRWFRWIQTHTRRRAIKKAFSMIPATPDVVYGHFWSSAYLGYSYAKKHNIPLFVATGESEIDFRRTEATAKFCDYVKGVVCVSSKNKEESINLGLTVPEKCGVFPNAVNTSMFHQMDKEECRRKLGIPKDVFVAIFVGGFNERKGPNRVAKAIKRIDGEKVYSVFIGWGDFVPECDNVLFCGSQTHEAIPLYLGASDVFALPTLHEGCCNAIIEAMACGLPIISSNLPFNWDILDDSNSIMVNPNDVEAISKAIVALRDNAALRNRLTIGALKCAANLSIGKRAENILAFIDCKKE